MITFIQLFTLKGSASLFADRLLPTHFFSSHKGKNNPEREEEQCKRGSTSSAEQKTTCEPVLWLLDEGGDSGVEGSASHLHHHRLEVSTLSLLRDKQGRAGG